MRKLALIILLALSATASHAEKLLVLPLADTGLLVLTVRPCVVKGELYAAMRAAGLRRERDGLFVSAFWRIDSGGGVVVVYSDGDVVHYPRDKFRYHDTDDKDL